MVVNNLSNSSHRHQLPHSVRISARRYVCPEEKKKERKKKKTICSGFFFFIKNVNICFFFPHSAARSVLLGKGLQAKIAGFTRHAKPPRGGTWPIRWTAPEVLQGMEGYCESSVCWSFGVLMFEIWTQGGEPYAGQNSREVCLGVCNGEFKLWGERRKMHAVAFNLCAFFFRSKKKKRKKKRNLKITKNNFFPFSLR